MFLLPPVPGTPVYLGAGLLLTSKAQRYREIDGGLLGPADVPIDIPDRVRARYTPLYIY